MKWIIIALSLSSLASFAQTAPQECLKVQNNLDRRYCLDKYLESVKTKNDAEKKSWGKGLPQATKDQKSAAIESDIAAKKELMKLMESEIALSEKQLSDLKSLPVTAEAAPKKKKEEKKKKKGGFRIKL